MVVYLDHDMDSTVTGGKSQAPHGATIATTDAIFIGAIVAGSYSSSGLPADSLVLATESGSVYVAVSAAGVAIKGNPDRDGEREQLRQHKRGGQHDRCRRCPLPRVA